MRVLAYILIFSFLFSGRSWHSGEWKAWIHFFDNACEHISSGDSFTDFLRKHYGDEETVKRHFNDHHPGEKPYPEHHHKHSVHFHDVALWFYVPQAPLPESPLNLQPNFHYQAPHTSHCIRRCIKPPENRPNA